MGTKQDVTRSSVASLVVIRVRIKSPAQCIHTRATMFEEKLAGLLRTSNDTIMR